MDCCSGQIFRWFTLKFYSCWWEKITLKRCEIWSLLFIGVLNSQLVTLTINDNFDGVIVRQSELRHWIFINLSVMPRESWPHDSQRNLRRKQGFSHRLTNDSGLQVNKDGPGYIFPGTGLTKECGEGVIMDPGRLLAGHLAIGLNPMLQTVQFPAGIAHLDACLANMDRNTLTLWRERETKLLLL